MSKLKLIILFCVFILINSTNLKSQNSSPQNHITESNRPVGNHGIYRQIKDSLFSIKLFHDSIKLFEANVITSFPNAPFRKDEFVEMHHFMERLTGNCIFYDHNGDTLNIIRNSPEESYFLELRVGDLEGNDIPAPLNSIFIRNSKKGLISCYDLEGRWIFKKDSVSDFDFVNENRILYKLLNGKYGMADYSGKELLNPTHHPIRQDKNPKFAWLSVGANETENKWILINLHTGKQSTDTIKLKENIEGAYMFFENNHSKIGIIDSALNTRIAFKYQIILKADYGKYFFLSDGTNRYDAYNDNFQKVKQIRFERIYQKRPNNYISFTDEKAFILDSNLTPFDSSKYYFLERKQLNTKQDYPYYFNYYSDHDYIEIQIDKLIRKSIFRINRKETKILKKSLKDRHKTREMFTDEVLFSWHQYKNSFGILSSGNFNHDHIEISKETKRQYRFGDTFHYVRFRPDTNLCFNRAFFPDQVAYQIPESSFKRFITLEYSFQNYTYRNFFISDSSVECINLTDLIDSNKAKRLRNKILHLAKKGYNAEDFKIIASSDPIYRYRNNITIRPLGIFIDLPNGIAVYLPYNKIRKYLKKRWKKEF